MEAVTQLGSGAETIESMEWLQETCHRYLEAWNSHDPAAVAAATTEDVFFEDPALPEGARGHKQVEDFVRMSVTAVPDLHFVETGAPAISEDGVVAYVPWRMTGTNTGPSDPPGFAPTGRSFVVDGVDVTQFREGLIWRNRITYDFAGLAQQLGLLPASGSFAEKSMVRLQRLRAKLPI